MKTSDKQHTHQHHDSCCGDEHQHTEKPATGHNHSHDDHDHAHDHTHDGDSSLFADRWALWLSLSIMAIFLAGTFVLKFNITRPVEIGLMLVAYVLAGHKTIRTAGRRILRGDLFNEFTLMTIATLGAFYIGEFSEGVAVMIFYEIGELFQDLAVSRSKRSIKALLDIRPDTVTVIRNGVQSIQKPQAVASGEILLVRPGEKLALDGVMRSESGTFNTAALTGEPRPAHIRRDEKVLAGMINTETPVEVEVRASFEDSKLSKILEMVQDATARKAPTQLLVSRLAKIYTPIVFFLALAIIAIPYFFDPAYSFDQWLYRGMVFLVIACPCALTISVPLGYFGGIGLASRNGILVKGANFLDILTKIDTVVSDKTGTLTEGVFEVQKIETQMDPEDFMETLATLENYSTHPVARAILRHTPAGNNQPDNLLELAGYGLTGTIDGKRVLAGNIKLLDKFGISYPAEIGDIPETIVALAVGDQFAGYVVVADKIKDDAAQMVTELREMGIETVMLSGDKAAVVSQTASALTISQSHGNLLPEDKVSIVKDLKAKGKMLAFVGDGVNDAPVIALADVGIAMGGLGSDVSIETADIVIQNDQPSRIASAIRAARITKTIVYQNITLAMTVKIAVMLLGAGGIATLWEAVFADVGVALVAILNALRIQSRTI